MNDWLLFGWLTLSFLFDVVCLGFCSYRVFWCGNSGAWYILALILCSQGTLFKVLRKRYGVREN